MAIELKKEELEEVIPSIQQYIREEFDQEVGELKAKLLLEYFMKEIAPFAYNQGVKDAEGYLRARLEDLPGACFEEGLGYWDKR